MPTKTPLAPTDDLIGLIYRGPLEPVPWRGFLEALSHRMECRSAALVLRLSRQGTPPLVIWGVPPSVDEDEARRIRPIHAELGHLDPLRNALTKPGDIHRLDEVVSDAALRDSEFYRRILRPYGIEHMLGMYISEPGGWEGNVGLTNGAGGDNFSDDDKAMLVALRPHLEQSLALFARIQRDESELQALIDTLDRLTICTFILDGSGRVIRANSAGQALIDEGETVRAVKARLALANRTDNAAFQALIARALEAHGRRHADTFVEALRVAPGAARHVGILVRTIDAGAHYSSDSGPAVVVYVAGSGNSQPLERLVMQLFDLTPSEAQLATLLATGFNLAEAAEKLGLTENTVRTYSKTILSKTGVSRQADLVRLILRSVAVLA